VLELEFIEVWRGETCSVAVEECAVTVEEEEEEEDEEAEEEGLELLVCEVIACVSGEMLESCPCCCDRSARTSVGLRATSSWESVRTARARSGAAR
jgi:hypothetical protein